MIYLSLTARRRATIANPAHVANANSSSNGSPRYRPTLIPGIPGKLSERICAPDGDPSRPRLPAAERDIAEALAWPDARSLGVGNRLLDEVDVAMARIRDTPMLYRTVHGPVRRAAVRAFPYFIWFVLADDDRDRAHVIAVTRHRRDTTEVRSQVAQRRPS